MGRFAYLENLSLGAVGSYTMGIDQNVTLSGPQWSRLLNEDLTWEVGEKINLGIDLQLFKALDLTVDIFKETRRNIFINRTTVPNILGMVGTTLSSNLGRCEMRVLTLLWITTSKSIKTFTFHLRGLSPMRIIQF